MAKKDRKKRIEEEPRELTRKQQRLNAHDRERNRRITIGVATTLGLVALVLLLGGLSEYVFKPRSTVATVGSEQIVTRDFWKRIYFEQNQLENQLLQYRQLEEQFGGQGFFTAQLNQIQATLSSPFSLGVQVLDNMIAEKLITQDADARSITVSEDEVNAALREEIAAGQGAVTEAQATSTAEAATQATATAASWTPTPTATIDASAAITATATTPPTPEPPATRPLLTDDIYQTGLTTLEENLKQFNMSVDDYREIVRARLLREKLSTVIGEERVAATEEQVHARHILLREITPTAEPTALPEGEATPEPTATATPLPEGFPTPRPTPGLRTLDEAKKLAEEVRQRLVDGEDFATLAAEYSDDLSNAQTGGDLGWFGRGAMVAPFEEAAFALEPGEISQPIETQFGYHLIEVLERDAAKPKDEAALGQERTQAFSDWLQEQLATDKVERGDLESKLPRGLTVSSLLTGGAN